jgi:dipeptidyl aminopeptidase/acylaminoacyl peptidase
MGAPLIERRRLFGNPSRAQAQVSPDGRWLSWLAPLDGVMNIWTASVGDPGAARAVTTEKIRPIRAYFWAPDSALLLFLNDVGGDENYKLFGVPPGGGETRLLTPFDGVQAQVVKVSPQAPDRILVGLNNRDARWHDVHALDLATGALTEVFRNDGFGGFLVDQALSIRVGVRPRPDGGQDYHRVTNGVAEAAPFDTVGFDEAMTTQPQRYTTDGRTLYWLDARGRDKAALIAEDVESGVREVLAEDPRADILAVLFHPETGRAQAWLAAYLSRAWTPLDPAVERDLAFLKGELGETFLFSSRSRADDIWIVESDEVVRPPAVHLFDRTRRQLTRLFVVRPELEGSPLAPMLGRQIRSRDGLIQPSYLTLPPGSDAGGRGRPDQPLPMVLVPHGGPWARDMLGFNPFHQLLANRGYAVLSPNFRGSVGFGKAFLEAGNLEWGAKMHDDLIDAVRWAVDEGITTESQVAIFGGSYGGYCVLAGLAFTPDVFACGVDIVGPSNLETLLATTPAYWEAMKVQLYRRVGDPTTAEGRALLKARSPLTRADQIRRPLLIVQGANDPRVKQAEADQIVTAMRERSIPVTYVLFPDEGHGFARPENNIAFIAVAEHFLAETLGGRAEPYGDAFEGSSISVPYGRAFAPGLESAMEAAA